MKFHRPFVLVVLAFAGLLCPAAWSDVPTSSATGSSAPKVAIKVAAILPGVVTDADYNTLAEIALLALEKSGGGRTARSESVPVPDYDRVAREYIDDGFRILWAHGGQYIGQTLELAREFPEVSFLVETDAPLPKAPPNVWVLDRNFHLGFYALGVLASSVTKTGRIGYIGGLTLPFSYAEVHALRQALHDRRSRAELKAVWAGDFNDPAKARQVADAMIADGIDVIVASLNLGIYGVFESVKAAPRPILVTAKYTDKSNFAPDRCVTSELCDFTTPLAEVVRRIERGERGGYVSLQFGKGLSLRLPLKNVPPSVQEDVEKTISQIMTGQITVRKDVSPAR